MAEDTLSGAGADAWGHNWPVAADDTLYDILNVPEDATAEDIKTAYRRLSMKLHPDKDGSEPLFRRVQEAYDTLSDPERRANYDRSFHTDPPGAEHDSDEDSGWVRVDEPDGTGPSGASSWEPPRAQWPPPSNSAPPPRHSEGSGLASQFARHPAGAVAASGVALLLLGAVLDRAGGGALSGLGFLLLVIGLTAMAGTRRATMRYGAIQTGAGNIDAMSGTQFEMLLEALFVSAGYRVSRVGRRGDFGADLLLDGPTGRTVVQAKRWSRPVGPSSVQEAVAAVAHYGASHAMVVTTSSCTAHARALARSNGVVLWDRLTLREELIRHETVGRPSPVSFFFSALGAGIIALFAFLGALAAGAASTSGRRPARRSARRRRPSRRRRARRAWWQ